MTNFGAKSSPRHTLVIDELNNLTFLIGGLAKLFRYEVYFFNPQPPFRSEKAISRLNRIGFRWLNFSEVDFSVRMSGVEMRFALADLALQNGLLKSPLYQQIVTELALDDVGVAKMNSVLKQLLTAQTAASNGPCTISLARYVLSQQNPNIIYFPASIAGYLLGRQLEDDSIVTVGWHLIPNLVISTVPRLMRWPVRRLGRLFRARLTTGSTEKAVNRSKKTESSSINQEQFTQAKLAFFPHKNLNYGPFFNKTYLYVDDPESPLYRQKVLTLFNGQTDPVSARYLRMYKIPFADVNPFVDKKRLIWQLIKLLFGGTQKWKIIRESFSVPRVLSLIFLVRFLASFLRASNILDNFPSLQVIFVHYDILFPQEFIFACYHRSIETISKQERPLLYNFFGHLLYDNYFICGQEFKQKLLNRYYNCRNFIATGQPRTAYICKPERSARYSKYIEVKRTHKLVVCYGLLPIDKMGVGIYGQVGTSEASNLDLLWTFKRLADTFPQFYFVVRCKETKHFNRSPYIEVVEQLSQTPNLEITKDIRKQNSYKMAYLADLVMGKSTSIMEECFAAGKPIIFYDNEGFIRSLDFVLNGIGVVASNYDELQDKLAAFLRGEPYFDVEKAIEIRQKYYSSETGSTTDGFDLMRQYVIQTINRLTTSSET